MPVTTMEVSKSIDHLKSEYILIRKNMPYYARINTNNFAKWVEKITVATNDSKGTINYAVMIAERSLEELKGMI